MNTKIVRYILCRMLGVEAALLLVPVLVAVIYQEKCGIVFLIPIVILCLLFLVAGRKRPEHGQIYGKEGMVIVALAWILWSLFGAMPFTLSGYIPSYVDAFFETVSGFTTTGASILSDVEALPHCMLMWRSFTHWIGGMGVLVFILSLLPLTGGYHMNLMKAESPGPSVSKLAPKVQSTAKILYSIYFVMTVIQILLLLVGGMPLFDSICTAFGTAGTGGFGIKNDSMASYSTYLQVVITVFMILFGVNFNAFYLILLRNWKQLRHMDEVWWYFGIIGAAILIIMTNTYGWAGNILENLRNTSFQVGSIITTTGFMTVDFDQWPSLSRYVLLFLMMIGACAGSTGGGMKVSRFLLSVKSALRELNSYLFPKSVKKIKMDGKTVDEEAIRGINVYFTAYILLVVLSVFLICINGMDIESAFSSVLGTFNNIGPGLGKFGPTCNFGWVSTFSKYVYIFDMLAGRLELFPVLILLYPPSWRGLLKRSMKRKKNKRATTI